MQHKDLVLIDCAPTESILTRTAYHASRYVLLPAKTENFSTLGFRLLKNSLDQFRAKNREHAIDVCGVLIHTTKTSRANPSKDGRASEVDIAAKAKDYGWQIFANRMHHSDSYPRWAQDPHAGYLRNAEIEWPKIANEILAKIGLHKPEKT